MASSATQLLGLQLTPHKVSVCLLIRFYFQLRRHVVLQAAKPEQNELAVHTDVNQLADLILRLRSSQGALYEPSLFEFEQMLRKSLIGSTGEVVVELWRRSLIQLDSPDSLFDLFIELKDMIRNRMEEQNDDDVDAEKRTDSIYLFGPESPMGLFLRSNIILFNDMSFSNILELYEDIISYSLPFVLETNHEEQILQEEQEMAMEKEKDGIFFESIDKSVDNLESERKILQGELDEAMSKLELSNPFGIASDEEAPDNPDTEDLRNKIEGFKLELETLDRATNQLKKQLSARILSSQQREERRITKRKKREEELSRAWLDAGRGVKPKVIHDEVQAGGLDVKENLETDVEFELPSSAQFPLLHIDDTLGEYVANEFGFASLGPSKDSQVLPLITPLDKPLNLAQDQSDEAGNSFKPNYYATKIAEARRPTGKSRYNRRDLQAALHAHARSLSRKIGLVSQQWPVGRRSYDPVESLMREFGKLATEQPFNAAVHYARYLASLQQRDYTTAQDALHAYFDAAATQAHRPKSDDPLSAALQYAALGLAHLHLHFGHIRLALSALHEALKTAQRAQDQVCLSHVFAAFRKIAIFMGDHVSATRLARASAESQFVNAQRARHLARLEQERRALSSNTFAARALDETIQELTKPRTPSPGVDVSAWIALAYGSLRHSSTASANGKGGGGGGPHGALSYFVTNSNESSSDMSTPTKLSLRKSVLDLATYTQIPPSSKLSLPKVDPAALTTFTEHAQQTNPDLVSRPPWTSALMALRQGEAVASDYALNYPADQANAPLGVFAKDPVCATESLMGDANPAIGSFLLTRAEIWLAAGFPTLARAYTKTAMSTASRISDLKQKEELENASERLLTSMGQDLESSEQLNLPEPQAFSAADALTCEYTFYQTNSTEAPLTGKESPHLQLKHEVDKLKCPENAKDALQKMAELEAVSGGIAGLSSGIAATYLLTPNATSPLIASARIALSASRVQAGIPVKWDPCSGKSSVSSMAEADVEGAITTVLRYLQMGQTNGDSLLSLEALQTLLDIFEGVDDPCVGNTFQLPREHTVGSGLLLSPVDAGGVSGTVFSTYCFDMLCVGVAWSEALGRPKMHAELLTHLASALLRLGMRDQSLLLLEFLYSPVMAICHPRTQVRLLLLWCKAVLSMDPGNIDDVSLQRLQFCRARSYVKTALDESESTKILKILFANGNQTKLDSTPKSAGSQFLSSQNVPSHLKRRLVHVLLLCHETVKICTTFEEDQRVIGGNKPKHVKYWTTEDAFWDPVCTKREALYVMARVCEELGLKDDRDSAAKKFVDLMHV